MKQRPHWPGASIDAEDFCIEPGGKNYNALIFFLFVGVFFKSKYKCFVKLHHWFVSVRISSHCSANAREQVWAGGWALYRDREQAAQTLTSAIPRVTHCDHLHLFKKPHTETVTVSFLWYKHGRPGHYFFLKMEEAEKEPHLICEALILNEIQINREVRGWDYLLIVHTALMSTVTAKRKHWGAISEHRHVSMEVSDPMIRFCTKLLL